MAADEPHKYAVITEDLRTRIRSGEFAPGSALPSHSELKRRYGNVSDGPVNQAARILQAEGLIVSAQGKARFVADPLPEVAASDSQRLDELEAQFRQQVERIDDLAERMRHLSEQIQHLREQ